jgi:prevent-host-death family protein
MGKIWPVQDAKARFAEFLRHAEDEPQVISYRGKPKFEVRTIDRARRKTDPKATTLLEALRACPKIPEFEIKRIRGRFRPVKL